MMMKDCIKDEEQLEKKVHYTNITRYLETTSSFFGNNPGPLKMKFGFDFKNSQLYLYNQLRTGFFEHTADIAQWIEIKVCSSSAAGTKDSCT